jgi:phosphate transport system permease protein
VVIRSSEEMLKLVPDPLREASYASAPPSPVTLTVVLPRPSAASGALLAIAEPRRDGAALFTILTVTATNANVFRARTPLCPRRSSRTPPADLGAGPRLGAALTLIAIAFILMIVARRHRAIHAVLT